MRDSEEKSARSTALTILSRRQYTSWELKSKLRSRGYDTKEIQQVIEEFEENRLLNDYDYAVRYSETKRRSSQSGQRLISARLKAKGVSRDLINQAIHDGHSDAEEYDLAASALEKRLSQWKNKLGQTKEKTVLRASGFLLRRGFSEDTVLKVIRDVFSESEFI